MHARKPRLLTAMPLLAGAACAAHAATTVDTTALAREILDEQIAIDTTYQVGTAKAAAALARRFRDAGYAEADVRELAPADHPEKGNVVVRLRGKGGAKPVLYIMHLDVVAAKREDWTSDPFKLTERDGWLYGRGTIDMKGQVAAVAANLIRMKREGYVPERDIVAAFTADEEAGGAANGVAFLLDKHRALVDAEFSINPDGGEAGMKNGKRLYLGVQTSEKTFHTLTLTLTDKGGHSSRPTADNPIYRMSKDLARLSEHRFPVHLSDTTRAYFARRAALESGQVADDMRSAGSATPDPAALDRLSQVVETNIVLRTTCTITGIEGGHAENALPQRVSATLQCRVIPGEPLESIERQVRDAIQDPALEVTVRPPGAPGPESPPSPAILGKVEKTVKGMWPEVLVLPYMSAGATDSKYLRAAGIPAYGVDAMFDDLDDGRAHGRDERISVAVFAQEVEFTGRLMREVAKR
jgi:acetylornithine deacetylase/succinyl-diaminopimelate desuccinylase-like protein